MSWRSLIDWALRPIISYAGDCMRAGYATGRGAASYSGYDETAQAIALGGASLAQELCGNRTGPRPTHDEFFALHFRGDIL